MRAPALIGLAVVALLVGCGGSSDSGDSTEHQTVPTTKRAGPQRRPATAAILGIASRYVDSRVADGRLPRVHVGRAGVIGKVALVYLVGGSDVGGGAGGPQVRGLYGVLVLANSGGSWRVTPPVVAFGRHS